MRRPDSHLSHSDRCMVDCVANQVEEEHYVTRHVCADSSICTFVTADQARMYDILKAGHLPLVANRDYTNESQIELLDSEQHYIYVAISHVWSHGLGNPRTNSLPRCQLEGIRKLVRELYPAEWESVSFWIDTICCPLQPREARALSIVRMRRTYKKAERVLVLDAYLEQIEAKKITFAEMIIQISISTWMTRLWTLQESALAAAVSVHFADGSVSLEQIEYWLSRLSHGHTDLLGKLIGFRQADYSDMAIPPAGKIQFAVKNRSTSRTSDEPLCLAPLAGLDVSQIAKGKNHEERTYEFWKLMDPVPSLMAFWRGPRLTGKGRKWAPSTLRFNFEPGLDLTIAQEELELRTEFDREKVDHINDQGMLMTAPGVLLNMRHWPPHNNQTSAGQHQILVRCAEQKLSFHVTGTLPTSRLVIETQGDVSTGAASTTNVLFALILKRGKRVRPGEYDRKTIDDIALLVRVDEFDPREGQKLAKVLDSPVLPVLLADIECNVTVQEVDIGDEISDPAQHSTMPAYAGTVFSDAQQWRIRLNARCLPADNMDCKLPGCNEAA